MRKIPVALCGNQDRQIERVYARGRRERLQAAAQLIPGIVNSSNFSARKDELAAVEALFSTWGMDEDLAKRACKLPKLRAFFYAAGSVQHFARPLLDKGVVVMSAWAANAVPVAQFTLGQILLSLKGYFRNVREFRLPDLRTPAQRSRSLETDAPGVFEETVALLGCGMVGGRVAELLRPFGLDVIAFDPFLSPQAAAELGVRKAELAEAFSSAYVVSNHLADLPATKGMLRGEHFASMRYGATFINTGRGATVSESGLAAVLKERPDLTALLDVTHPEPAPASSPWFALNNVHLSSHIAGSNGNEVVRMADYCLDEFEAWSGGKPLRYGITKAMLETMA